jgi:hypothetical protein
MASENCSLGYALNETGRSDARKIILAFLRKKRYNIGSKTALCESGETQRG